MLLFQQTLRASLFFDHFLYYMQVAHPCYLATFSHVIIYYPLKNSSHPHTLYAVPIASISSLLKLLSKSSLATILTTTDRLSFLYYLFCYVPTISHLTTSLSCHLVFFVVSIAHISRHSYCGQLYFDSYYGQKHKHFFVYFSSFSRKTFHMKSDMKSDIYISHMIYLTLYLLSPFIHPTIGYVSLSPHQAYSFPLDFLPGV